MFHFTSPPAPLLREGAPPNPPQSRSKSPAALPALACVAVPNLPIQVERARYPAGPLIVSHPLDGETVFAASGEALRAGVQSGMPIHQACKMVPHARLIPSDEAEYHARQDAMHEALRLFSGAIETVGLGEFLMDVRGLERVHGGYEKLAKAIQDEVRSAGRLPARVGIAAGKFTARQAARVDSAAGRCVVPEGDEARFLSSLPVSALPDLPGEIQRRLALLDIHTLGQLVSYRKPAMLRQFGPQVSELYELARGNDRRPLQADLPPLRVVRSKSLDEPIDDRRILLNLVNHLSNRISRALQMNGYHAEALKLSVEIGRAHPIRLEHGRALKPPTAEAQRLSRMAMHLLAQLGLAAPVSRVCLCAYPLRSWRHSARQQALIRSVLSDRQARIEEVMQDIVRRFGEWAIRFGSFIGPPVPIKIEVRVNAQNWPCLVTIAGNRYLVNSIDEDWHEERGWWLKPIRRYYYRVMLDDSSLRNIFKDLISGEWYLDRAWPIR